MRWVDRDAAGRVRGYYAHRQAWHADSDATAANDEELLAFDAAMHVATEAAQRKGGEQAALLQLMRERLESLSSWARTKGYKP